MLSKSRELQHTKALDQLKKWTKAINRIAQRKRVMSKRTKAIKRITLLLLRSCFWELLHTKAMRS